MLAAAGPDALIARRNIDRAAAGHAFAARHAVVRGPDAAPVLVRPLDALTPDDACIVTRLLLDRWGHGAGADPRSWKWSRSAAARAVERASGALEGACEGPP